MKNIYDLYGFKFDNLEEAREKVESVLNIQFQLRQNDSIGEYYLWGKGAWENIIIQKNFDEYEQEWEESKYKQASVLVYVNAPKNPQEIHQKLTLGIPEILFLEHEEVGSSE